MNKRKAIIKFCVICFITAIGVAAIYPYKDFRVPFTNHQFLGFAGAIENKMGIDLKGGVLAIFDCQPQKEGDTITPEQIKAAETRLLNALSNAGLVEATVQRQGNDKIRVEVPGLNETDEIFRAIGDPAQLDFRDEQGRVCVEAQDISKVTVYQNPQTYEWGVLLTFTNSGGKAFRAMIEAAEQYTFIYKNGKEFSQVRVEDRSAGSNNTTVITLGKRADGSAQTRKDAEEFKLQIESGLYEVKLVTSEMSIIPQTLGAGALLGGIIALAIGILFIFIFMYIRYGDLGLLSNLALIIFMVLFLGALALVNTVQLTLPGIAGIVLALAMAVDANIIIFERIRDEYRAGKRIAVATESGFNKSFWTIFDANITTIIGAAVLYFLGTGPIQGFAITLLLGVIISMFCSLLVTRSFAKLYLYINPSNARRMRLESTNPFVSEAKAAAVIKPPAKRALNLGDK